jgi:hypothetical protein
MEINLIQLIVIIVLAGLAWWANGKLNTVPVLKNVIDVLIVVVAILLVLQSLGIMGHMDTHYRVN